MAFGLRPTVTGGVRRQSRAAWFLLDRMCGPWTGTGGAISVVRLAFVAVLRQYPMRDVNFVGSSLDDLRSWPKRARHDMGRQIDLVQRGLEPSDWRPMPGVGRGVREIRLRDAGSAYRSIYVTNIGHAVYILHVFVKKSRKTPVADIHLAKSRLKSLRRQLGL